MDNTLYIFDEKTNLPSIWWRHFNDMHYPYSPKQCGLIYFNIFKEHKATPIYKERQLIGLTFESEQHKTAFLLKYG